MIQGKKVTDISELLGVFEAQEGEIQSYSGGIGQGKTYGATRRVIRDLLRGRVVYTNWQILLDGFSGDQRTSLPHLFFHTLFFRKRFYNIEITKNWHYFDMEDESTWYIDYPEGRKYFETVVDFIATLTDCTVYLDEGQDIFDSYEGTRMSKKKRKSITRTRHLNKTLIIISQRPQAIAVTARANVNVFYKHVKAMSWPLLYFKVYATEELDQNNMPQFDIENSKPVETYFANKKIYNAYNSKYLRGGIPISQQVFFEAFDLSFRERFLSLFSALSFRLKPKRQAENKGNIETLGVKSKIASIKKDKSLSKSLSVRSDSVVSPIQIDRSVQHGLFSEVEKPPF